MTNNNLPLEKYFYMFADQIVTRGYTRTLIADTSRQALHFIDNSYYEVLVLCRQHTIGEILEMLESENDIQLFTRFLSEMIDKRLGIYVEDIALFPEVERQWDHPSIITNAIIDIRDEQHDYNEIFSQLDELGCEHVEIRVYKEQSVPEIEQILKASSLRRFKKIFYLTRYSLQNKVEDLGGLFYKYPFLSLTIYGTPKGLLDKMNKAIEYGVTFIEQIIHSSQCCGNISFQAFAVPKIRNIMENLLYNGCLNRKISIDENGFIKNCPSSQTDYGHITTTSLRSALDHKDFSSLWGVNKDQIKECSDCEYRSVCTDCRVFIKDQGDRYSKPSKCKYDPYSGQWAS